LVLCCCLLLLLSKMQVSARHVSRELLRQVVLYWGTACISIQHPVPNSTPFDAQRIPGLLSAGVEVTTAACCCSGLQRQQQQLLQTLVLCRLTAACLATCTCKSRCYV
jgi:hypothetical protein